MVIINLDQFIMGLQIIHLYTDMTSILIHENDIHFAFDSSIRMDQASINRMNRLGWIYSEHWQSWIWELK